MSDLEATLIQQNQNTMDVIIEEKYKTIPSCTCGKCIARRKRDNGSPSFPYNKNMASTYKDDYDWKTNIKEDPNQVYNRAKHNSFEGGYRQHIPSTLISTAKMCYKPFKVKREEKKPPEQDGLQMPFLGKSTYFRHYPSWGKITPAEAAPGETEDIVVPLRGNSNYTDSYPRYNDRYYSNPEPLNFVKPTLKFNGELDPRTTYLEHYKPNDLSNKNYFPGEEFVNEAKGENNALKSAPFSPGTLGTTYRSDYVPYEDQTCKLRKYLNERGLRYLVI